MRNIPLRAALLLLLGMGMQLHPSIASSAFACGTAWQRTLFGRDSTRNLMRAGAAGGASPTDWWQVFCYVDRNKGESSKFRPILKLINGSRDRPCLVSEEGIWRCEIESESSAAPSLLEEMFGVRRKQPLGSDCNSSSDCQMVNGMCCQQQRLNHRASIKRICGYFRDAFDCVDMVGAEHPQHRRY
ncbi:uncharacterized protein LOC117193034 [Drosophila miranda]|uniref:uncharacterized protein LOC117193034 n=1 Tax=Drosophila miranda TaxID=7229 RepID=UPI00143F8E6E|nr:uncharacterized protein LOC117193034 [Drosophila miranda]